MGQVEHAREFSPGVQFIVRWIVRAVCKNEHGHSGTPVTTHFMSFGISDVSMDDVKVIDRASNQKSPISTRSHSYQKTKTYDQHKGRIQKSPVELCILSRPARMIQSSIIVAAYLSSTFHMVSISIDTNCFSILDT